MKLTTLRNPAAGRGGMSANAFGGHDRLDKLDLSGPSQVGGKLWTWPLISNPSGFSGSPRSKTP